MAALRAARGVLCAATRRSNAGVSLSAGALASSALKASGVRAFMSTRAPDSLFTAPSYPMPASEDPSLWKDKYPRADPSLMWKVGSFPLQDGEDLEDGALSCSEDLWDTPGMLSALNSDLPLRDADGARAVDDLLRQLDHAAKHGYLADSVIKKRRKKMNKHKHRKRKKALRMRTKMN